MAKLRLLLSVIFVSGYVFANDDPPADTDTENAGFVIDLGLKELLRETIVALIARINQFEGAGHTFYGTTRIYTFKEIKWGVLTAVVKILFLQNELVLQPAKCLVEEGFKRLAPSAFQEQLNYVYTSYVEGYITEGYEYCHAAARQAGIFIDFQPQNTGVLSFKASHSIPKTGIQDCFMVSGSGKSPLSTLKSGEQISSLNKHKLAMNYDCNLVLSRSSTVTWTSDTSHAGEGCYLQVKADQDIVLYTKHNVKLWALNFICRSSDCPPTVLKIDRDGDLTASYGSSTTYWETKTKS